MIIVASTRGNGKALGVHLLNADDNEHIRVGDIRGFVSEDVIGAMKEAEAIRKGTKCRKHLFSVSFNPPEGAKVTDKDFKAAIAQLEDKLGLESQPRVVIYHTKEGRTHCHAAYSLIDAQTMTAKPMKFFKRKVNDVSKDLFLEHGWTLPAGYISRDYKDPRNFTLAEWQQSKRMGIHTRDLKRIIQERYAGSDTRQAFAASLEEIGMKLAKGDKRGHVIVTHEGEVLSVGRCTGKKAKEVRQKLGDPNDYVRPLPTVDQTKAQFVKELTPTFQRYLDENQHKIAKRLTPLTEQRQAMTQAHRQERAKLKQHQRARWQDECLIRSQRLNTGWRGLWDTVTGQRRKTQRNNEIEAYTSLKRDQAQRQDLRIAQAIERASLQATIKDVRATAVRERLEVHKKLYQLRQGQLEPDPMKLPLTKDGQSGSRGRSRIKGKVQDSFANANTHPAQAPSNPAALFMRHYLNRQAQENHQETQRQQDHTKAKGPSLER